MINKAIVKRSTLLLQPLFQLVIWRPANARFSPNRSLTQIEYLSGFLNSAFLNSATNAKSLRTLCISVEHKPAGHTRLNCYSPNRCRMHANLNTLCCKQPLSHTCSMETIIKRVTSYMLAWLVTCRR